MKRWRPPTRPLILIALLLLAGAVVNVAVAWVLVGAPDSWTPGGPRDRTDSAVAQRHELRARLDAPKSESYDLGIVAQTGFGWTMIAVEQSEGQRAWLGIIITAGWPSRSMALVVRGEAPERDADSLTFQRPLRMNGWFAAASGRTPRTPIPAGFAINTLFYAAVVGAILALPLSVFPIRRRLRARRGRCPKCGYDLAGLGGAGRGGEGGEGGKGGATCPECGGAP